MTTTFNSEAYEWTDAEIEDSFDREIIRIIEGSTVKKWLYWERNLPTATEITVANNEEVLIHKRDEGLKPEDEYLFRMFRIFIKDGQRWRADLTYDPVHRKPGSLYGGWTYLKVEYHRLMITSSSRRLLRIKPI